jgi:NAD(P)-dependent dehydrogenase (short-subunit alcohol dehydrogenase family)
VSEPDLGDKTAVVTGGNSGIGKETANELARMGAHVVIAARNPAKAAAAVEEIRTRTGAGDRIETMPIDLASFASVRAFVDAFTQTRDRLDILVNNAGLVLRKKVVTVDGHEATFQINHLSHFLLTTALQPQLAKAPAARVVTVSSAAHAGARTGLRFDDLDFTQRRYGGWRQYCNTKLMNILFTRELAQRWDGTGITANCVHPGFVGSNFGREGDLGWYGRVVMPIARPFAISNEQGAITSVYLASSPDVDSITGQYFVKCKVTGPTSAALDDAAAARLWEISEELTA